MNGSGTELDPYQVSTLTDLDDIRNSTSAYYILVNDIDASATSTWNSGDGWLQIDSFYGEIDGDGHVIDSLFNATGGFIDNIEGGTIKNLKLTSVDFTGLYAVGGIANYCVNSPGVIQNCAVTGTIATTITDPVTDQFDVKLGGIIGIASNNASGGMDIDDCYFIGTIDGTSITTSEATYGLLIGGITATGGYAATTINNCYTVTTANYSGGLTLVYDNAIAESTNTTFTDCYYDNEAGNVTDSNATGLTTSQSKDSSNYTNWDFSNTWFINSSVNNGYPELWIFSSTAGFSESNVNITAESSVPPLYENFESFTATDVFSHSDTALVNGAITLDMSGSVLDTEGFENGNLGDWYDDSGYGDAWSTNTTEANTGSYSAGVAPTTQNYPSYLVFDFASSTDGTIEFYFKKAAYFDMYWPVLKLQGYTGSAWEDITTDLTNTTSWTYQSEEFTGYTKLRFLTYRTTGTTSSYLDDIEISTQSVVSSGTCILEPINLSVIDNCGTNNIDWTATIESAGSVSLSTAINSSATTAPSSWTSETDNTTIDTFSSGADYTGDYLWVKVDLTLSTDTTSPSLDDLLIWAKNSEALSYSGSSEITVSIVVEGSHIKTGIGSSEATLSISSEASGVKIGTGSSEPIINVNTEQEGIKSGRSPPAEANIDVNLEQNGSKLSSGSSEQSVETSLESQGNKLLSSSSEVTLEINLESNGIKTGLQSSETSININSEGLYNKLISDSSETSLQISSESSGFKRVSSSSESTLEVGVEGAGEIASVLYSGSSEISVLTSTEQKGIKLARSPPSNAEINVDTDSSFIKQISNYSEANIVVNNESSGSPVAIEAIIVTHPATNLRDWGGA